MKTLILTVVKQLPKTTLVVTNEPLSARRLAYINVIDAQHLDLNDVGSSVSIECVSYTYRTLCDKDGVVLTTTSGEPLHTIEVQR